MAAPSLPVDAATGPCGGYPPPDGSSVARKACLVCEIALTRSQTQGRYRGSAPERQAGAPERRLRFASGANPENAHAPVGEQHIPPWHYTAIDPLADAGPRVKAPECEGGRAKSSPPPRFSGVGGMLIPFSVLRPPSLARASHRRRWAIVPPGIRPRIVELPADGSVRDSSGTDSLWHRQTVP
jgi:hypothetical protein